MNSAETGSEARPFVPHLEAGPTGEGDTGMSPRAKLPTGHGSDGDSEHQHVCVEREKRKRGPVLSGGK